MEVASRYYRQGMSQNDIARELELDPSTISRYLKRARDEGIVQVEIVAPRRLNLELGVELAQALGLGRVVVAEDKGDESGAINAVAAVGAQFVSGQLRQGMRVGMGWGETLALIVQALEPGVVSELHVTQLAGGMAQGRPGIQGHELIRQLVELYPHSRATYLHAPSIVDSRIIRDAFLVDRSIQAALALAAQSDIALVGIGDMHPNATLFDASQILAADREALLAEGAVGSMNARFYNAQGQPVGHLDQRTVALEWAQLRTIPQVIAIAAGLQKAEAILGACRSGSINVLITDEPTAAALARLAAGDGPA